MAYKPPKIPRGFLTPEQVSKRARREFNVDISPKTLLFPVATINDFLFFIVFETSRETAQEKIKNRTRDNRENSTVGKG